MTRRREDDLKKPVVQVGRKLVGQGRPVYVIADIGSNHNGDLSVARATIEGAARAGCDAIKFQKRTPELAVPREQWNVMRNTPWGRLSYLDYRHRAEFGFREYHEIDAICRRVGIEWFASCWDEPSVIPGTRPAWRPPGRRSPWVRPSWSGT